MSNRNWEQLMCNRNQRIHKRNEEISEIEKKTKNLMTEKDYKEHEKNIIHIFPEVKTEPYLLEVYKEKFQEDFIRRKIKDKLGEETEKQYNHLHEMNTLDEYKNIKSLRRHGIK